MSLLVQIVATLSAAFGGTFLAFLLEFLRRKANTRKLQISSGNKALFVLGVYLNELVVFRKNFINPYREIADIHLIMRPSQELKLVPIQFDFSEIDFLIDSEGTNILHDLLLAEQSYRTIVQTINERSQLHIKSIQPAIEKAGIGADTPFLPSDIKKLIGDRLDITLHEVTHQIVELIDDYIPMLEHKMSILRSKLKEVHPSGKYLSSNVKE